MPPISYFPDLGYHWSGPYLGLNGGYGFGNSNWNVAGLSTGNFNIDGLLLGGTFGANFFEINGFVLGAESDLDWAPIGGSSSQRPVPVFGAPAGLTCQSGSHWLSTWRAERVMHSTVSCFTELAAWH